MQRRYLISLAVVIALIGGIWVWGYVQNNVPDIPVPSDPRAQTGLPIIAVVLPDGTRLAAEVVTTPKQQQKGLMFRDTVPSGTGMLFVYDEAKYQQIWMKNVYTDLDVVFIGDNKQITNIVENIQAPEPEVQDDDITRVTGYGQYILELGAGDAQRLNLAKGLRLRFDN